MAGPGECLSGNTVVWSGLSDSDVSCWLCIVSGVHVVRALKWSSLKQCQFLDCYGYFRRKTDAADGESYDPYDFSEAEKEMPQGA